MKAPPCWFDIRVCSVGRRDKRTHALEMTDYVIVEAGRNLKCGEHEGGFLCRIASRLINTYEVRYDTVHPPYIGSSVIKGSPLSGTLHL